MKNADLRDIANLIGDGDAIKIARYIFFRKRKNPRDKSMYIPKESIDKNHWLVTLIGKKKTKLMQKEFGSIQFPRISCQDVVINQRNKYIVKKIRRKKMTPSMITNQFKISPPLVTWILKKSNVKCKTSMRHISCPRRSQNKSTKAVA